MIKYIDLFNYILPFIVNQVNYLIIKYVDV